MHRHQRRAADQPSCINAQLDGDAETRAPLPCPALLTFFTSSFNAACPQSDCRWTWHRCRIDRCSPGVVDGRAPDRYTSRVDTGGALASAAVRCRVRACPHSRQNPPSEQARRAPLPRAAPTLAFSRPRGWERAACWRLTPLLPIEGRQFGADRAPVIAISHSDSWMARLDGFLRSMRASRLAARTTLRRPDQPSES